MSEAASTTTDGADRARLIAALAQVRSATLADASESADPARDATRGYADARLRSIVAPAEAMVGWAVTVAIEATTPGPAPDHDELMDGVRRLLEAVAAAPDPVVVVCHEIGPSPLRAAHVGEILVAKLRERGGAGVVTDAAVRDVVDLRALGMPVFATGTVAGHGTYRIREVGVPVEVCGMAVRTGDLVHGDEDGVVTVAAEHVDRLLGGVRRIESSEADETTRSAGGER